MHVGVTPFLILSALMFSIGLYGAVSKKSAVTVLMSLELMSIAVSLNLVALSRFVTPALMTGQAFALFVMVVSAAEVGMGLALVLSVYRRNRTVELPTLDRLKG
jgi:NADH:ubiquinone oxidoreductase subunit K